MKILVGLSGGVDSTYAALKLINEGHEVSGAVLKMHEYTDILGAKTVADELGIELHVIDATATFSKAVVPNFISEYLSARTPNPCIICNERVKFRVLLDYALQNGFEKIATGHYARIVRQNGRYALADGADKTKDQTYMLYRLSSDILSHLVLPLADLEKKEVVRLSSEAGISAAERKESQEICFIPDNDYASYIERAVGPSREGDFVDEEGRVLGRHKGIIRYTVGQRKGLGVSASARIFVKDIDPCTDKITLSLENPPTKSFMVKDVVWSGISPLSCGEKMTLLVRVRYRAEKGECTVLVLDDGTLSVTLKTPQHFVTKGQSAVFYLDDTVAFGGFID